MKLIGYLFIFGIVFTVWGCQHGPQPTSAEGLRIPGPSPTSTPEIESQSTSVALLPDTGRWKIDSNRVGTRELTQLFFLNKSLGWIGGFNGDSIFPEDGTLYRVDGGKRATRLPAAVEDNSYIVGLFFLSETRGWLAVQTEGDIKTGSKATVSIVETIDGGRHWKVRFVLANCYADHVVFSKTGRGYLSGYLATNRHQFQRKPLLMTTSDFGTNWEDVTSKFSPAAGSINRIRRVFVMDESSVAGLADSGIIIENSLNGENSRIFRVTSSISENHESSLGEEFMLIHKFGDRRWVVTGGRDSKEGIWTTFYGVDNERSQQLSRLDGVIIKDLLIRADGTIFACGSSAEIGKDRIRRTGIILASSDFVTWRSVYRTDYNCLHGCSMNKMFELGEAVEVVGSNGLIVSIK